MAEVPPDTLNEIGILRRREIEARIVGPLVERLSAEFGAERVHAIVRDEIVEIARRQGAALAESVGSNDIESFTVALAAWSKDGALETEMVELSEDRLAFNVTRCKYAELYRALGLQELGATLSCNRDGALMEGFNPNVEFRRTQTIMQGATHCDFDYRRHGASAARR